MWLWHSRAMAPPSSANDRALHCVPVDPKESLMFTSLRLSLALLAAGVLLGGCSHEATRPASATSSSTSAHAPRSAPLPTRAHAATTDRANAVPEIAGDDERTGIAACDDYLSSYLACHRAAHVYAPGQLQPRYEAMRTGLLRDARNPDIRPHLAARCNALSTQLRQVLHGKPCAPEPTSPSP